MTVDVELPSLGEGVESADVAEVLVREGDVVEAGQSILELETEKAVMEVPCPVAGRVQRVAIKEGETVRVGQKVLTIEAAEAPAKAATPAAGSPARPPSAQAPAAPPKSAPPTPPAATPSTPAASATPAAPRPEQVLDFVLPSLGEGVASADVAEVLVKVGDTVAAQQPVLELETEKAVMEVPCPWAGTITAILVKQGDQVTVGQTVLQVRTTSAASAPAATAPRAQPAASSAPPTPAAPATSPAARALATASAPRATTAMLAEAAPPAGPNGSAAPVPAAPSTRRLARKLGVDLRSVHGSGPGGRITAEDVQSYVRDQLAQRQAPAVARPSSPALLGGALAPPPLPDFTRFGPVEREPLNKIARTAAENLTVSWNVIPHVTQHDRADITELEAARKRFAQGLGKNGPKVTMTAIAIKALTTCLQAFPKFNSSLDPETHELVLKRYYHIGCAVDTPNGLLVPVVKDCDKKSILDIAAAITDLAEKARERKLTMDLMQGATCTVTNLGGIGGTAFTPIVNYPEVCILGMARSQTELQLVNGQVTERLMLPLALSYDHRVINGADAARFVATLCQMLSDPFQLLSAI